MIAFNDEHNNDQEKNSLKSIIDKCRVEISNWNTKYTCGTTVYFEQEIECLMNMVFAYMSFLVNVGINPKKRFDEIIEEKSKTERNNLQL